MGLSLCNENLVFAGPEVQGGREPAFWFCWVSKTSKSGFPASGALRRDSGLQVSASATKIWCLLGQKCRVGGSPRFEFFGCQKPQKAGSQAVGF